MIGSYHCRASSASARAALAGVCAMFVLPLVVGCKLWTDQRAVGKSPLRPVVASPDSVALEIFFARFPHGDAELCGPAWNEIDEMQLPGPLRRELRCNGFRVGLVGGTMPRAIARLLKLQDRPPDDDSPWQKVDVEHEPTVTRQIMRLRSGRLGQIAASGIYDRLPMLRYENGQVHGRDLAQAQCMLAVTPTIEGDGRVRLELLPEVHYGQPRHSWSYESGIMRPEIARPKEVLDRLRILIALAPGQMLVVTSLPDRPGSLGHYFFADESSRGREQKMLIIRLAQVPRSDLFSAGDKLSAAN